MPPHLRAPVVASTATLLFVLAACSSDSTPSPAVSDGGADGGGGTDGAVVSEGDGGATVQDAGPATDSGSGDDTGTTGDSGAPTGCEGITATPTLSGAVQPIFTASCATSGCHRGSAPRATLNLATGMAHGQLVNVGVASCFGRTRVVPGRPKDSYLVNKLTNVDLCNGNRMPPAVALPAAQIDTIRAWICAGAKND